MDGLSPGQRRANELAEMKVVGAAVVVTGAKRKRAEEELPDPLWLALGEFAEHGE